MHDSEGAAAAITVRNSGSHTLSSVPIAITVRNAHGQTLYQNNAPGLEAGLTQISSMPAHGSVTWVDDQVPTAGQPASVRAVVGEAPVASGPEPRIEVAGTHLAEASTGEAAGTVRNGSNIAQRKLVVYVIARRGGTIVAAGRAVLAEVAAGAPVPFQAFLVGAPTGAQLERALRPARLGDGARVDSTPDERSPQDGGQETVLDDRSPPTADSAGRPGGAPAGLTN